MISPPFAALIAAGCMGVIAVGSYVTRRVLRKRRGGAPPQQDMVEWTKVNGAWTVGVTLILAVVLFASGRIPL